MAVMRWRVINVITGSPEYLSGKARFGGRGKLKYMSRDMEKSGSCELSFRSENLAILGNVNYKDFGDIYAGGSLGYERPSGYGETGVNLKAKLKWRKVGRIEFVRNDFDDLPSN